MRTATEVPQTKQNKLNKRKTLDRGDRVVRAQVEYQKKFDLNARCQEEVGWRMDWEGVGWKAYEKKLSSTADTLP